MSESETLEPEKVADFAALTGRLVKLMRDEVKRPVAYWELTNELAGAYQRAGKLDDLWKLYTAMGAAVKKVDPGAEIGGPALTWGNPVWVKSFLATKPDVDFISWHNYATGDLYESNDKVFEIAATAFPDIARSVMKTIADSGQKIPQTFLTEYNVKYTWDPYERRHQNAVGAVFWRRLFITSPRRAFRARRCGRNAATPTARSSAPETKRFRPINCISGGRNT